MRVLQTIGHRPGKPPTPFYYKRDSKGVTIRSAIGDRFAPKPTSHKVWNEILKAIEEDNNPVFGVSESPNSDHGATKIHKILSKSGINNSRHQAYVTAILVHEGTLMIEHGPKHDDLDARVFLRRSDVSVDNKDPSPANS